MATTGSSNGGGDDGVELEAMRKDTFSWHPCQVSLCSSALGLLVQYGDNNLEEIISDKDGVFAQVRVRSTPLQGDDCSLLQQGDCVLATQNAQVKSLFYDAQVEEAFHVRHSKRIHCRCSFKIKWLHQPLEEKALTVPASAIKKLSTKSITLHPIICTFFNMLETSNGLNKSPILLRFDDMKLEVDISMLLEKQIEDINKSSDAPEKKISKNKAFGLKDDLKEQSYPTAFDVSLKDPCIATPLFNNLRASMGTDNEQSPERIVNNFPDVIPLNQGQFMRGRLPLSPLAARAALALLRSKFPQSAEHSVQSNVEHISLKTSVASGGRSKNYKSIVRTLFPASISPPEVEFPRASSGAPGNRMGKKRKNKEKWTGLPSENRVTRSQAQRNNRMQESAQMTNVEETQLMPSPKTRRITRSMLEGAEKNDLKQFNAAADKNMETKFVQFHTPQNTKRPQSCLSDMPKSVVSPIDGEHNIDDPIGNDRSLLVKDGLIAKDDSQKKGFARPRDGRNCSRRITRSAAREEMKKKSEHSNLKDEENSISVSRKLDLLKGNVSPEPEKPVISPDKTETGAKCTKERQDNRDTSGNETTSNAGSIGGNARRKCGYPKKQEIRSSPRLRSFICNRSQSKV